MAFQKTITTDELRDRNEQSKRDAEAERQQRDAKQVPK